MSDWKCTFTFGDAEFNLDYQDIALANWTSSMHEADNDYMSEVIDAKVHELQNQKNEVDKLIYRLRQFQRTLRRNNDDK